MNTRNCPKCSKAMTYSSGKTMRRAERKQSVCKSCSNRFKRNYTSGESHHNYGREWSDEQRARMSVGAGGNGELNKFYRGRLRTWARRVIKRDCCCQKCKSTEDLHAHHLLPKALLPDLAYELGNGIALCSSCHYELHQMIGKKTI